MKRIPLTQGKFALVDDEDYVYLVQWKWCAAKGTSAWYAMRKVKVGDKQVTLKMHRLIMKTPKGMDTDHINSDGLDNRRQNLRVCSRSMHNFNRRPQTGRFKGTTLLRGKWNAQITIAGKHTHVGRYTTEEDAARAYDKAAVKCAGEFARPNFPKGDKT